MTAPQAQPSSELLIVQAENLGFLREEPSQRYDLIYIDPPFNTGRKRALTRLKTESVESGGDRTGFAGKRYRTVAGQELSYADRFDDYARFLGQRLVEAARVLTPTGSLFLHLDPRESHYAKVMLDELMGREAFMNEIIWSYDFGGRPKNRWPPKHDTILWYAKDPRNYTFNYDEIDRVPYMAPSLVGEEKARRGKTPTDVWWNTIVGTSAKERTGYPTQKPLSILERIVMVHSNPGERVLDFFAGSGTTGEAALRNGRHCVLVDDNPKAIEVMRGRLAFASPRVIGGEE